MADDELDWRLRVSSRARHARLRILPYGGLEVVIPRRFPRHRVAELVAGHAEWARTHLAQQAELRNAVQLPRQIKLPCDNSVTTVRYPGNSEPLQGDLFGADTTDLVIQADNQRGQLAELRHWIRQRARTLLPPRLESVSKATGLGYRKVSIRSQKTRWGSCSSSAAISLNDQLLFVPAATVDYLMIHELCHTRQLDHSPAFWSLVETHCPDYRRHEALLEDSRQWVPEWYLLSLYD